MGAAATKPSIDDDPSNWGGISQGRLNEQNRFHIRIICRAFDCGPWNVPTNWNKAKFHEEMTSIRVACEISTFDRDALTRFVILAHHHAVRVRIAPASHRSMRISMSTRGRHGSTYQRHPDLDEAVTRVRPVAEPTQTPGAPS